MATTSRSERNRRRESALSLVSQGKDFSDVVTAQMSQWGCSFSSAQRDCRWVHDQLQLSIDSHDDQHLMVHMAPSLQLISLKAEEDKQYAAAVGAQTLNPRPISVLMSCRRLLAHSSPDRSFGISWVLPCAH